MTKKEDNIGGKIYSILFLRQCFSFGVIQSTLQTRDTVYTFGINMSV